MRSFVLGSAQHHANRVCEEPSARISAIKRNIIVTDVDKVCDEPRARISAIVGTILQYEQLHEITNSTVIRAINTQLPKLPTRTATVDTTNGKAGAFPPSPPLLAPLRAGWAFPPTWGRGLGKRWARGSRTGFLRTGGSGGARSWAPP